MNWLAADLLLVAMILLVRAFLLRPIRVKGHSMQPTLHDGDFLLLRVWGKRHRCRRGEIVVCHYPGRYLDRRRKLPQCFVKRVIGLPGEVLSAKEGKALVNGNPLEEPYLGGNPTRFPAGKCEVRVGRNRYFVMGDNREHSNDSRRVGTIYREEIIGTVIHVIHMPEWFAASMRAADQHISRLRRRITSKRGNRKSLRQPERADQPGPVNEGFSFG